MIDKASAARPADGAGEHRQRDRASTSRFWVDNIDKLTSASTPGWRRVELTGVHLPNVRAGRVRGPDTACDKLGRRTCSSASSSRRLARGRRPLRGRGRGCEQYRSRRRAADGVTRSSASCGAAGACEQLKSAALVAPLLLFLLSRFVAADRRPARPRRGRPRGAAGAAARRPRRWRSWDGKGLPDEPAFAALVADIARGAQRRQRSPAPPRGSTTTSTASAR